MLHEDPETYPFWTEACQTELGQVRIGLSEVFLETLEEELVGLEWLVTRGAVRKGDALAQLHTAHRALPLRAPFNLELLEVNEEAARDPRLVRDSPYYEGWLAEVRHR